MSKKSPLPQSRRHIMLYDEDWEFLEAEYGIHSPSKVGAGTVVKLLVHQKVQQVKARANQAWDSRNQAAAASQALPNQEEVKENG